MALAVMRSQIVEEIRSVRREVEIVPSLQFRSSVSDAAPDWPSGKPLQIQVIYFFIFFSFVFV